MKLTQRDKQLLIILLIIGVVAIYYQFVYLPQSSRLKELYEQKTSKEMQLIDMRGKVAKLPAITEQLEDEKKSIIPLAQKYLGNINQEDLILMINDFESKSSINIKDVSFNEVEDFEIVKQEEQTTQSDATNSTSEQSQGTQTQNSSDTQSQGNQQQNEFSLDNIKMTNTEINFRANYNDLASFIKILDDSSKNIVSNKLNIKKTDPEEGKELASNPQDYIEGSLNLQFFRVNSIEKYAPTQESILKKNPVKKTLQNSPFLGYTWAIESIRYYNKDTGEVVRTVTDKEEINRIVNNDEILNNNSNQTSSENTNVSKKNSVEYKKPVELVRFDSMNDFSTKKEDETSQIDLSMGSVEELNYKILKSDVEYNKDTSIEKRVYIDLSKKMLKLQDRPESLMLNLYSQEKSGYEIGLVFISDGKRVYVPFNSKLTFSGWKELELDTKNVNFPATVESIYMKRNSNFDSISAEIYVDSLYANYVQTK